MNKNIEKNRGFEIVCASHRKHPEENILLPIRATAHSIAYDIYSPVDITIESGKMGMIWTDVKAYFKPDEALLLNVRSSMGKQPVMIANTQGWIESDYYGNVDNDGNLGIRLFNLGETPYVVKKGDRIAQAMFINYLVADNGNTNVERTGGFGCTGR